MSENTAAPANWTAPPADWLTGLMSDRLRRRRFALLPVHGPGAPGTDVQGRQPGPSTAPEELSDLISSIDAIGVLQPVLAEEIPAEDGTGMRTVITVGERRLRAVRWGAVNRPDNPHFASLPAVVCPGPLSEEERRIWQLVENLAREPLRPADLAQALLLHRCALLAGKLLAAARPVPAEVYDLDDPVARWAALEKLRGDDASCAAPWSEVLSRLGLQLTPRKAREIVRAFAGMPRELAEEMDEARISIHTRIRFIELRRGRAEAADEIWAAVRSRARPDLLPGAVSAALTGNSDPDAALDAAEQLRAAANAARAGKLSAVPAVTAAGTAARDGDDDADPSHEGATGSTPVPPSEPAPQMPGPADGESHTTARAVADPAAVTAALNALRHLNGLLATARLEAYDAASIRLLATELLRQLPTTPKTPIHPPNPTSAPTRPAVA